MVANENDTATIELAISRLQEVAALTGKMQGLSPTQILLYAAISEHNKTISFDEFIQMVRRAWKDLEKMKK